MFKYDYYHFPIDCWRTETFACVEFPRGARVIIARTGVFSLPLEYPKRKASLRGLLSLYFPTYFNLHFQILHAARPGCKI